MLLRDTRAYALLSIAAALVTISLKSGAYVLAGSVGLLSDALESVVNLATALVAFWALWLAARPADTEHAYGHSKAEYVASAVKGALIVVAAAAIAISAWPRLLHPRAAGGCGRRPARRGRGSGDQQSGGAGAVARGRAIGLDYVAG